MAHACFYYDDPPDSLWFCVVGRLSSQVTPLNCVKKNVQIQGSRAYKYTPSNSFQWHPAGPTHAQNPWRKTIFFNFTQTFRNKNPHFQFLMQSVFSFEVPCMHPDCLWHLVLAFIATHYIYDSARTCAPAFQAITGECFTHSLLISCRLRACRQILFVFFRGFNMKQNKSNFLGG